MAERDGFIAVRDRLLSHGLTIAHANGLAAWLLDQGSRRRLVSEGTAIRYRAELRRIGSIPGHINSELVAA